MHKFSSSLKEKKKDGLVPVIVDFKCISPGEGRLFDEKDAVRNALKMIEAGAPAISVVTEPTDFGGSLDMLRAIVDAVDVPVLRKDFIRTKEAIDETIECGASAVLLMCSVMSAEQMVICYNYALERGIEPLVETHTEAEIEFAASLGAKLMGINNRDILRLEKDGGTVSTTQGLAGSKPEGAFLISESGILTPEDVRRAIDSGADAALVGTAIWKAEDPFAYYKEMMNA